MNTNMVRHEVGNTIVSRAIDETRFSMSGILGAKARRQRIVESALTMYSSVFGPASHSARSDVFASIVQTRARIIGMASTCEYPRNRRENQSAKYTDRLKPKWHRSGCGGSYLLHHGQLTLPADRIGLTQCVVLPEHVKPVVAKRQRVKDEEVSECRFVTKRIGVALQSNITPRESGLTDRRPYVARALENPRRMQS